MIIIKDNKYYSVLRNDDIELLHNIINDTTRSLSLVGEPKKYYKEVLNNIKSKGGITRDDYFYFRLKFNTNSFQDVFALSVMDSYIQSSFNYKKYNIEEFEIYIDNKYDELLKGHSELPN